MPAAYPIHSMLRWVIFFTTILVGLMLNLSFHIQGDYSSFEDDYLQDAPNRFHPEPRRTRNVPVPINRQVLDVNAPTRDSSLVEQDNEKKRNDPPLAAITAKNNRRRLEFVHITKTAGSAIEAAAAAQIGIRWGLCHFEKRPGIKGCQSPDWKELAAHRAKIVASQQTVKKRPNSIFKLPAGLTKPPPLLRDDLQGVGDKIELWHTPPSWFVPSFNPYRDVDTFVVVRNPYDRVISEFYCKYFGFNKGFHRKDVLTERGIKEKPKVTDLKHLTATSGGGVRKNSAEIVRQLQERKQQQREAVSQRLRLATQTRQQRQNNQDKKKETSDPRRRLTQRQARRAPGDPTVKQPETPTALNKWIQGKLKSYNALLDKDKIAFQSAHLLPQHYYVFDQDGKQTVTTVLRYESLHDDFATLVKTYDLAIDLPDNPSQYTNTVVEQERRMTTQDLTSDTILLINDFFADDFRLLNYDMIEAS